MRMVAGLLLILLAVTGCAGPFGRAPLVLTEVPNRPTGQALIARGAEESGCRVSRGNSSLHLDCPEGALDVPTFPGPPTFAVRCVDARLEEVSRCTALVRKVLLASETPQKSPVQARPTPLPSS